MSTFSIQVVDDEDEGIGGVRVRVSFLDSNRSDSDGKTDSDGYVELEGDDEGEVEVFLNNTSYGTYEYSEGDEITIEK